MTIALDTGGHARDFTCVYHAWNYDLKGNLKAVAFEDGVSGKWGVDATAKPALASYTPRHRVPHDVWARINLADFGLGQP